SLMRGRGRLPLGRWGRKVLEGYRDEAAAVASETRRLRAGDERECLELDVALALGLRLRGTLGKRFPGGRVEHTYSKFAPKRLLELWIRHLSQCAGGAP